MVRQVYWSIEIRLWVLQFPKDGATVHAMKQGVIIGGLVGESSVVQEHILQTLAAFQLMCYLNGGAHLQNGCSCAKASSSYGWLPAMHGVFVVANAEEKAWLDENDLSGSLVIYDNRSPIGLNAQLPIRHHTQW